MRKRSVQKGDENDEPFVHSKQKKNSTKSKRIFLQVIFLALFILYIVIPVSVYLCPSVRRHAVFLNYVSLSRATNLSVPSESGLKCARNFYISSDKGVKLGVWHVPPASMHSRCKENTISPDIEFSDQRPVFLYLHGNAGDRAGGHRVSLYKVLSEEIDAHVVAFDYRGFGDSTNVSPTEAGLVEDTTVVYDWLLKRVKSSNIFVWGHSLGTGVGTAFLEKVSKSANKPTALILEAPFTRIVEAAKHHPLSIFHRYMPFFDVLIAKPIGDEDTGFDSLSRIPHISRPLLILHAEDDGFVPYNHGKILYESALATRKELPSHFTKFVGFDGELDLGHKNIYKSPDLPNIIKNFLKDVQS
ncbi:lysophosphatidylserine lipase ABHD12 [Parasteatoda tepidariorum]|uniref:lysophosphatidylserine lipase ABHD12 n=1 Tax=Parasteatoda tepidariorum TaxID=114398 RepID=UPI001C7270C2|nr:lysophosphatidylserine lipase ABHD12 [Parasteatoda tepidariorum]